MKSVRKYKAMFEVDVFHDYHLNDGETSFNDLADDEKDAALKKYDHQDFIEIQPCFETRKYLRDHKLVCRKSKRGLIIIGQTSNDPISAFESYVPLSGDVVLIFTIKIKDGYFDNYTTVQSQADALFCLSNFTPDAAPGSFETIPLTSSNTYLNSDMSMGTELLEEYLEILRTSEKLNLYGLLILKMNGASADLSILDAGEFKEDYPKFKIHFENRKTIWRYHYLGENITKETKSAKPLTKNGFVQLDLEDDFDPPVEEEDGLIFPNPSIGSLAKTDNKFYSDIYI